MLPRNVHGTVIQDEEMFLSGPRTLPVDREHQNHQLSWWYALRLEGDGAGDPTRALNGLPVAFPSRATAKAAQVFVFLK